MSPQPALDQIPFGGHFRFEVVDGKVVDHRAFTNSCLTMPLQSPEEGAPAGLMVSHILDETPTEIHVFSTYVAGLPIYVSTVSNDRVWVIELIEGQPRVRLIRND